ncbi:MAG: PilZ domain-containing protein [Nitrospirota bacterium]
MNKERRGCFRIDDIFALTARKVHEQLYKKSKVFSGYSMEMADTEAPDGTIDPVLWKALIDINAKLALILEKLQLKDEGFIKTENRQVNISETGMRFVMNEKVEAGDVIEIKMLLYSRPPLGILTYGNVVRVKDIGSGRYEVALHFSEIDDEVREELIRYILKRQREMIRKHRQ